MFGKTKQGKQRFRCLICNKTFVWKRPYNKKYKEQHWFKLWISEGYSIRQLSNISGYSEFKLKLIKNYWLSIKPKTINLDLINKSKYLIFDGTYFNRTNCFIVLINSVTQEVLACDYIDKENYLDIYNLLKPLKNKGLDPIAVTLDGLPQVAAAFKSVWPKITIQRCLYHIQKQSLQWLRIKTKIKAAKELKPIIKQLCFAETEQEAFKTIRTYKKWYKANMGDIKELKNDKVTSDLKKTISLINHAIPNMYHFIKDQKIASTTNLLEGFFSQLKHKYRDHRGLSEQHKIAYLKWFCYFKNMSK